MIALLRTGEREPLKAGVHATAALLAAVCGVYNFAAIVARRELKPHLVANVALYAAITAWEIQHVRHHLDRP